MRIAPSHRLSTRRVSRSGDRRRTSRLRAHRGAITALVAILMVAMVGMLALAADFGRLDNLKADLKTSADAGALAGAFELMKTGDVSAANTRARAFALANKSMQANVTVTSVVLGCWSPPGGGGGGEEEGGEEGEEGGGGITGWVVCGAPQNAVRVTVTRQSSGLFMSVVGVSPPNVQAVSTASYWPASTPPCNPPACSVHLVNAP